MKNAEIESTEKGEKIPKRVTDGGGNFVFCSAGGAGVGVGTLLSGKTAV